MFTLQGIAAAGGIAIGPCILYDPQPPPIPHIPITPDAVSVEKEQLVRAIQASIDEIRQLRDVMIARVGKAEADIFEAHLLILEDEALLESAYQQIEVALKNAAWAIWDAAEEFAQALAGLSDSYFQARATDIHDLRMRVVSHLLNYPGRQLRHLHTPVIIAARDLLPSDTAGLDTTLVLGLITEQGGPTSHTAILARQMGIPAVVGVSGLLAALQASASSTLPVALNGRTGHVVINPDEETQVAYQRDLLEYRQSRQEMRKMRNLPAVTPDGTPVELAANIGRAQDAEVALEAGAHGIGLFRTEFLFLNRSTPPAEEEQLSVYRSVLETFADRTVIVRTLDIGGDKTIPYLDLAPENNPFLGLRGIRLCLTEAYQHLFRTQLRALLRAAAGSKAALWLMFPMIDDLREFRQARTFVQETERALLQEGCIDEPVMPRLRLGIMVETPAAALLTDILAREVDFFSIGTNDLAQYTLAIDRMNANLAELHRPFHPAVMRSIAHIVTTAHQHQRWVGMCGEMAGDARAAAFLLGLGIDELSMDPSSLNEVKYVIRHTPQTQAQEVVQRVLAAEHAYEIEQILTNTLLRGV